MRFGATQTELVPGHRIPGASPQPTCMILEDQTLIALSLEAYLEEIGLGACESFASSAEALEWLGSHRPTVAILDFSLRDGPCTALACALRERGVPFVIYSGHRRDAAPPELRDVPWLSKPCDRPALLAALTRVAPALAGRSMPLAA